MDLETAICRIQIDINLFKKGYITKEYLRQVSVIVKLAQLKFKVNIVWKSSLSLDNGIIILRWKTLHLERRIEPTGQGSRSPEAIASGNGINERNEGRGFYYQ